MATSGTSQPHVAIVTGGSLGIVAFLASREGHWINAPVPFG